MLREKKRLRAKMFDHFVCPVIRPSFGLFIRPFARSFDRRSVGGSLTRSFALFFDRSLARWLVNLFARSLVRSFARSLVRSFAPSVAQLLKKGFVSMEFVLLNGLCSKESQGKTIIITF